MTCTFGIGMLYSDISLFTYVQIVVYFLNAAFQFYTSKVIRSVRRGSCTYFGGGARSWSDTGLRSQHGLKKVSGEINNNVTVLNRATWNILLVFCFTIAL